MKSVVIAIVSLLLLLNLTWCSGDVGGVRGLLGSRLSKIRSGQWLWPDDVQPPTRQLKGVLNNRTGGLLANLRNKESKIDMPGLNRDGRDGIVKATRGLGFLNNQSNDRENVFSVFSGLSDIPKPTLDGEGVFSGNIFGGVGERLNVLPSPVPMLSHPTDRVLFDGTDVFGDLPKKRSVNKTTGTERVFDGGAIFGDRTNDTGDSVLGHWRTGDAVLGDRLTRDAIIGDLRTAVIGDFAPTREPVFDRESVFSGRPTREPVFDGEGVLSDRPTRQPVLDGVVFSDRRSRELLFDGEGVLNGLDGLGKDPKPTREPVFDGEGIFSDRPTREPVFDGEGVFGDGKSRGLLFDKEGFFGDRRPTRVFGAPQESIVDNPTEAAEDIEATASGSI